jgi:hypothetical protein
MKFTKLIQTNMKYKRVSHRDIWDLLDNQVVGKNEKGTWKDVVGIAFVVVLWVFLGILILIITN